MSAGPAAAAGESRRRRLVLLEAVLRYESLYLHASKFRLGRRTTAPNNIKAAVPKAGFLELFDILVRGVAMIILPTYNTVCFHIISNLETMHD